MSKTCFVRSHLDTPIRNVFPFSTFERQRQKQVDILCNVHVLQPLYGLLHHAPVANVVAPRRDLCFSAGATNLQQILKVIV